MFKRALAFRHVKNRFETLGVQGLSDRWFFVAILL
jgi:hypothetical protein